MKLSLLARALVLCATILPLIGLQPAPAAAAAPSVTDPRNFVGANVPGSPGAVTSGALAKLSWPAVRAALSDGFAKLKAYGVHSVAGGPSKRPLQIQRDGSGAPTRPQIRRSTPTSTPRWRWPTSTTWLRLRAVQRSGRSSRPWLPDPASVRSSRTRSSRCSSATRTIPASSSWEVLQRAAYDTGTEDSAGPGTGRQSSFGEYAHAHSTTAVTVGSADLEGIPMRRGWGWTSIPPTGTTTWIVGLACARVRCPDAPMT